MRLVPLLQHLFRLPLALAIMVERIGRMLLVGILLVQAIDRHRREEDQPLDSVLLHRVQCHLHPSNIRIVIERNRRHVIPMLRGEQHHHIRSRQHHVHLLLHPDIPYLGYLGEEMALYQVDILQLIVGTIFQQVQQPGSHETAATNQCNIHLEILFFHFITKTTSNAPRKAPVTSLRKSSTSKIPLIQINWENSMMTETRSPTNMAFPIR